MEESNKYLEEELEGAEQPITWTDEECKAANKILWKTFGEHLLNMAADIVRESGLDIEFELFSTKLHSINNWNTHAVYQCVEETMFLKDDHDTKTGIGFIFNMITPETLFIGTIGTAYINEKKGLGISNLYWKVPIDYLEDDGLWDSLKETLENYIMAKYDVVLPKRD